MTDNAQEDLETQERTRPLRDRAEKPSSLRIRFESCVKELERELQTAPKVDEDDIRQVLTSIDDTHCKLYGIYVDISRSLKKAAATSEFNDIYEIWQDIDAKTKFVTEKLKDRSIYAKSMSNAGSNKGNSVKSLSIRGKSVIKKPEHPLIDIENSGNDGLIEHVDANVNMLGDASHNDILNNNAHIYMPLIEDHVPSNNENDFKIASKSVSQNLAECTGRQKVMNYLDAIEIQSENVNSVTEPNTAHLNNTTVGSHAFKGKQNNNAGIANGCTIMPNNLVPQLLMKNEALQAPKLPFTGNPLHYKQWESKIKRYINTFNLSPDETFDLLESHTSENALAVVNKYKIVAGFDPFTALDKLWDEFEYKFGTSSQIARALQEKLNILPVIGSDMSKLTILRDECEIVLLHMDYVRDFAVLDFTQGLAPLFQKLPNFLKSKWQSVVYRYSSANRGVHPPFSEFCKFLTEQVKTYTNSLASNGTTYFSDKRKTYDRKVLKTGSDIP